jgi:hypothetical protein
MALQHHTKTNTALFHAQWSFNLVHAASLSSGGRTKALWGNIMSAIIKHNSALNNSLGAPEIQYNSFYNAGARIA